ncbi:MAG TPA: hypothetical protein VJ124_06580 [Pyrinomonadaceae bacterium]|nr:hypothetical protein [Pyrinomonadaceae bacterium]
MKYEPIERRSKQEVESAIARNDPDELFHAVLSAALYSDDRDWSESICLRLSKHEQFNVRGNAILGFGHIARIHGLLNENKVKPVIEAALSDPSHYVRGQAAAAAADVEFILKWEINRS